MTISFPLLKNILEKLSLGTRLYILFAALLIVSVVGVGLSSYLKAKETTMEAIETRLVRETELMGYIAENLKFVYISDEEYFRQQLEASVRSQQKILHQDGILAEAMYIANEEVIPFKVSEKSLPNIQSSIIKKVKATKNGVFYEKIEKEPYTITFREMEEINGIFVLAIPTSSYMEPVNQMVYFMIAGIVVSIIVTTVITLLLIRTVTKPLNDLRNTMREVREGKFQTLSSIRTTVPEITSLHKSYHAMITHMSELLHELKGTTNELEKTGGELLYSSNRTLDSSHHLVEAIQIVRAGAEQTASSSEENAKSFKEMKQLTDGMMAAMDGVFDSSEKMTLSAKNGETNLAKLISTIYQFEGDFEHLSKTVKQVKEFSSSITNLVGLVDGITEQTKLLALNASIEAARAGDAGKGFAVVSQEVRKLAEQSTKVTEEISRAVHNMEELTFNATNEFENIHGKIKDNLMMAGESKKSFDVLMNEIENEGIEMKGIQQILRKLESILPELEQATIHFTSISQETLASSEEMLAESDNQVVQMEATNRVGLKLRDLSKSLAILTERFQLIEEEKKF